MADISVKINCENLAPISKLSRDIKTKGLKLGIIANNGSGKTFISRIFRILEGTNRAQNLISFGASKAKFSMQIIDGDGNEIENFTVDIDSNKSPVFSKPHYLYHTFNEDYIEDNVVTTSYDKNGDLINGFILGKGNIDVEKEKEEEKKIENDIQIVKGLIREHINNTIYSKINIISNIKRITEYKYLNFTYLYENVNSPFEGVDSSYDVAFKKFQSIKNTPDDLADIKGDINEINLDNDLINKANCSLLIQYNLSRFSDQFKNKIKSKQNFIEEGISILANDTDICPFCEQQLTDSALSLIDQYNQFINDQEAQIIKDLINYKRHIENTIRELDKIYNQTNEKIIAFDKYKSQYVLSMSSVSINKIENYKPARNFLNRILIDIDEKSKDISKEIQTLSYESINYFIQQINNSSRKNNQLIEKLDAKKNNIYQEQLTAKRNTCKVVFNELISHLKDNFSLLREKEQELVTIDLEIKTKEQTNKIDKKDIVASTIEIVLRYFFGDKYTFNKETFQLHLKTTPLSREQVKNVLSGGEKSIVAFAYYLGDVHLKITNQSDYEKIFFIIDDPVSSLDFNHVYTVCNIIRDIKKLFPDINKERFILFTHNTEFMRILTANKMLSKKLLLKNNELKDLNTNFATPYIFHLKDIYDVALNSQDPTHTTANSIRHVVETILRFEDWSSYPSMADFLDKYLEKKLKVYTLIQDLCHGGLRFEQAAITEEQYTDICKAIIEKIVEKKYVGQLEYIKKL